MPLVDRLFDGPIDIVGDIHGELGQLHQLLFRLGYDGRGVHKEGRRLVFVGDLVDRGPDSPGVVRLVRSLVESGVAQMVLGNHEINLIRRAKKHGNHWFWGEYEQLCNKAKEAKVSIARPDSPSFQIVEDPAKQDEYIDFLRGLPLVLERPGLNVLHAMYDKKSIDVLRTYEGDAGSLNDESHAQLEKKVKDLKEAGKELTKDEIDMILQNENPVKVVTTGMEVPTSVPFFAGGKMRNLTRYAWWEDYDGDAGLVVIGHYWRRRPGTVDLGFEPTGPTVFPGDSAELGAELKSLGPPCAKLPEGVKGTRDPLEQVEDLMEGPLKKFKKWNPNGDETIKHEQIITVLKELDQANWTDDQMKSAIEDLPDPVPIEKLAESLCRVAPEPGSAWRSVICIDYSAGLRFEERGRQLPEGSLGTALAALRLPEGTLHFADGDVQALS